MQGSRLVNRNVVAERGRTSMRLEPELWDALAEICTRERQNMNSLVRQIEAAGHSGGRTSAIRVFVVQYFRGIANEIGYERIQQDTPRLVELCQLDLRAARLSDSHRFRDRPR